MDVRAEKYVGSLQSNYFLHEKVCLFMERQGMKWEGEMPCEKYIYASRELDVPTVELEWRHLDEAESHIQALLRWVYDFYVVFPSYADKQICCYEQLVFEVLNVTFEPMLGAKWGLQLEVFSFWDQTRMMYHFSLS